jgi:hypothetical protein
LRSWDGSRNPLESGSNLNTDPDPQHKGIVIEEAKNLQGIIGDENAFVSLYLVAAFPGTGILLLSTKIYG